MDLGFLALENRFDPKQKGRVNKLETLEIGEFIYDYGKITQRIKTPLFTAAQRPKP